MMTALSPGTNAFVEFQGSGPDKVVLIGMMNVNTGDTLDVGPSGLNVLQFINRGVMLGCTAFVEIAVTWSGTVVTMPSGLANDTGHLLLWGAGIG
jgi:hypothetical protein